MSAMTSYKQAHTPSPPYIPRPPRRPRKSVSQLVSDLMASPLETVQATAGETTDPLSLHRSNQLREWRERNDTVIRRQTELKAAFHEELEWYPGARGGRLDGDVGRNGTEHGEETGKRDGVGGRERVEEVGEGPEDEAEGSGTRVVEVEHDEVEEVKEEVEDESDPLDELEPPITTFNVASYLSPSSTPIEDGHKGDLESKPVVQREPTTSTWDEWYTPDTEWLTDERVERVVKMEDEISISDGDEWVCVEHDTVGLSSQTRAQTRDQTRGGRSKEHPRAGTIGSSTRSDGRSPFAACSRRCREDEDDYVRSLRRRLDSPQTHAQAYVQEQAGAQAGAQAGPSRLPACLGGTTGRLAVTRNNLSFDTDIDYFSHFIGQDRDEGWVMIPERPLPNLGNMPTSVLGRIVWRSEKRYPLMFLSRRIYLIAREVIHEELWMSRNE